MMLRDGLLAGLDDFCGGCGVGADASSDSGCSCDESVDGENAAENYACDVDDGANFDAEANERAEAAAQRRLSARRRRGRRVEFKDPLAAVRGVPTLGEWTEEERRAAYWSHREYAQIRNRQRQLILKVLQQAREHPAGVIPPAISGESRRGLGLCCEPGTTGGRAARVAFGRRRIVEVHRGGAAPEVVAGLSTELSEWAQVNARDVGLKDHAATADAPATSDFTRTFFINGSAQRRANDADAGDDDDDNRSTSSRATSEGEPDPAASVAKGDGFGLASMVRSDSLTDLRGASTLHLASKRDYSNLATLSQRGDDGEPGDDDRVAPARDLGDGCGLASMVRNDSLTNLSAMHTLQDRADEADP
ncbi:hypothetical protein M885DRAFT_535836 [Pelagophyceae sp. CCMP2097]|nr:hypothetical protein M885DRAFT_535836 [Pelagophyceae sp. CCMP2097]|mmetsp:Transcript_24297/g.81931  ORF Transcript_24297/g.81931 Transcript_24297/m.81931 type:complete len:363 (-) Transcript_24297:92-1180(-)